MSSHAISIFISYESWETVKSGLQLFSQSPFGVFSSKMPHCFIVYKKKIPWCLQPSIKVHLLWWLFSLFFPHLVWPAACCTETAGKTAATERSFMPLSSKPILEIKLGQQVLVARIAYQYITRLFNNAKENCGSIFEQLNGRLSWLRWFFETQKTYLIYHIRGSCWQGLP